MGNHGSRNLIILVVSVWGLLFGFYGFLAYRASLWSPLWAIEPTTKQYAQVPREATTPGRMIYRELRCGVCHGPNGEGGVKNPNADPENLVPNLFDLGDAFTWNDLKDKISKGTHPAKLEEEKDEPPLDMPSWNKILSDKNLEDLLHYLFSLKSPEGDKIEE